MQTFFRTILRWIRLLTTGKDNRTPDAIRIGSILIGFQFLFLAAWSVIYQGHPFDPTNYGTGAAAILAATGAALGMAHRTQPE
jgi:hypothetical protein